MARLTEPGRWAWSAELPPPPYSVRAPNKNGLTRLSAKHHDQNSTPERAKEIGTLTFGRAPDLNGAFTVYDILKTSLNGAHDFSTCDTPRLDSTPDPQDIWLFTDPAAREVYRQQNRLDQLQDDIASYAMYDGRWAPQELEIKQGLQRLLCDNLLVPKDAFGHLSPHPTVYRAVSEGQLEVARQRFHFGAGDDIVFVPWVARVTQHPGLCGPVHIGRLQSITRPRLCCDAFPAISLYCEKALAILHQTLRNPAAGHPA